MGNSTILGYFLMLTPAFCISPGLIGKVYSAKDEPAIRKGTLLNGIVQLFLLFPDAHRHVRFCGVSGSFQPGTGSAQGDEGNDALWHFGTGSFRYFAAEVSTCDTVLYMLATSLSKDLYQTFIKPDATDAELLSMTRKITAVCGALGIIIAYYLASIIRPWLFLFPHDSVPCGTIPFWPFYQEGFDEGSFPFGRFGRCRSHGPAPFQWGNGHRHPQRDKLWDSCGGPCHGLESIRIFS